MGEDLSGFAGTTSTTSSVALSALAAAFVASAAATVYLSRSMDTSMMWMRMPGQTWLSLGAMFAGMWTVMMIAMMLPAMAPLFARRGFAFAAAYFVVWAAAGIVVYPIGVAIAKTSIVPALGILAAAALQLSPWKLRALSCCRARPVSGFRAGADCVVCCSGLMLALLVTGMMSLVAMAAAAAAIAIERLAPRPQLVAPAFGIALLAYGTVQLL